jgi:hypothetical protein
VSPINQRGYVDFVIKLYPNGQVGAALSTLWSQRCSARNML